jgi:hypothetical protein
MQERKKQLSKSKSLYQKVQGKENFERIQTGAGRYKKI